MILFISLGLHFKKSSLLPSGLWLHGRMWKHIFQVYGRNIDSLSVWFLLLVCIFLIKASIWLNWIDMSVNWSIFTLLGPSKPMGLQPSRLSFHGLLQVRILEWVAISSSRGSSDPGIEPAFPALQADSILLNHQGGPSNEWKSVSYRIRSYPNSPQI